MILSLTIAYLLDLIFGDPQWFPHPVRFMGWLINRGEKIFRRLFSSEIIGGAIFTVTLICLSFFLVYILLRFLSHYSTTFAMIVEIFLLYSSLSVKDLAVESGWVKNALLSGDIPLARKKLSWIVGRDTEKLDEREIVRATVETISENSVDGIVAPLFYAAMGGAPLAIAYKTINTLDSMIGYRNKKYIHFGKFAAKIDTWVNWLPARISGFLFPISAGLAGFSLKNSYRAAWQEGAKTLTPNSGIPEAAMAGALGVQVGGTNFYEGEPVFTPHLGRHNSPLAPLMIAQSIRISYLSSLLFFLLVLGARFIVEKWL